MAEIAILRQQDRHVSLAPAPETSGTLRMDETTRTTAIPPSFQGLVDNIGLLGWHEGHSELVLSRERLVAHIKAWLTQIHVDEEWYRHTYPDVREAIAAGKLPDARTHFMNFGYFESRLPHLLDFDAARYLELNPDLEPHLAGLPRSSVLQHFIQYGYREGREF